MVNILQCLKTSQIFYLRHAEHHAKNRNSLCGLDHDTLFFFEWPVMYCGPAGVHRMWLLAVVIAEVEDSSPLKTVVFCLKMTLSGFALTGKIEFLPRKKLFCPMRIRLWNGRTGEGTCYVIREVKIWNREVRYKTEKYDIKRTRFVKPRYDTMASETILATLRSAQVLIASGQWELRVSPQVARFAMK